MQTPKLGGGGKVFAQQICHKFDVRPILKGPKGHKVEIQRTPVNVKSDLFKITDSVPESQQNKLIELLKLAAKRFSKENLVFVGNVLHSAETSTVRKTNNFLIHKTNNILNELPVKQVFYPVKQDVEVINNLTHAGPKMEFSKTESGLIHTQGNPVNEVRIDPHSDGDTIVKKLNEFLESRGKEKITEKEHQEVYEKLYTKKS